MPFLKLSTLLAIMGMTSLGERCMELDKSCRTYMYTRGLLSTAFYTNEDVQESKIYTKITDIKNMDESTQASV